jgi:hypothetical protein
MSHKRKAAESPVAGEDTAPEITAGTAELHTPEAPPEEAEPSAIAPDSTPAAGEGSAPPVYAADPHPKITVNLADYAGGPRAHLLRSHRYNQMQIRFEGEQPDEAVLAMLKEAGWTDRTEHEGIWTKQIHRDARWQSVQKMEQEFKAVTDAIRKAKGLGPALEAMTPA